MDNVFGVDPSEPIEEVQGQVEEENTQDNTLEEESTETETPDEGQVEESGTEEAQEQPLILGKFKTQDDLTNAYRNLEREYTRMRQELTKQPQPQVAPQQEQPQADNEEAQLIAWYNQEMQTNPINANAVLAQYMAQKVINERMGKFEQQYEQQVNPIIQERQTNKWIQDTASRYSDFYNYNDKMVEIIPELIAEDPNLENSPQLFKMAYLEAKSRTLEENAKTAFENGKKTALEGKAAKQKLSNELGKPKANDALPEGLTLIPEGDGIFL